MNLERVNDDKNVYFWVNYSFKSVIACVSICLSWEKNWYEKLKKKNLWMSECVYLHFVHMVLFKHKRIKNINQNDGSEMKNITKQTKYSTMEKRINWTAWNKIARYQKTILKMGKGKNYEGHKNKETPHRGHKFSSKVKLIVGDKQKLLSVDRLSDTEVFYQTHEGSRQVASVPSRFIR